MSLEDKGKDAPVSFFKLFRYSTCLDVVLMVIGTLASFLHGAAFPVAMFIFGDITNAFIYQAITSTELSVALCPLDNSGSNTLTILNFTSFINMTVDCSRRYTFMDPITSLSCTDFTYQDVLTLVVGADTTCLTDQLFIDEINRLVYIFIGITVCAFLMGMVQTWFFKLPAERQVYNIRLRYYNSILRQEQAWFDVNSTGSVASHLSNGVETIHEAIGENIGVFLQYISTFVAAIVVGMVRQYQLALLLLVIVPFMGVAGFLFSRLGGLFSSLEQKYYASAGGVAQEVLGSITTVQAYGGEKKEWERYDKCLENSKKFGIYKGMAFGASIGSIYFLIFLIYSVSFWFGAYLVSQNMAQVGDIITVFFSILIGAFYVGQAGPNIQKLGEAQAAASVIYNTIDKEVVIDSGSKKGLIPEAFEPTVRLSDVEFSFPSRPDTQVLNGLNLTVNPGHKLALVGSSGSGKTSVIKLIQRLYDVNSGQVIVGGQNVKDLNLQWLRAQIGVVSQEPVLFDTTIAENIRHGKEEASMEEIEEAAKKANAHDFISSLPKGYETNVGEGGAQLSGGQKQRVAIARALVRNPKILLLDEATSALDSESEHLVQEALDKASIGRTTIVIAHRLSTIRDADLIASMEAGIVVEIGTHSELMEQKGHYFDLVTAQTYVEPPDRMAAYAKRTARLRQAKSTRDRRASRIKSIKGSSVSRAITSTVRRSRTVRNTLSTSSRSVRNMVSTSGTAVSHGPDKNVVQNETAVNGWAPNADQDDFEDYNESSVSLLKLIRINSKMLPVLLLGCIGAAVNGVVFPAFSIIFGEVLDVFQRPVDEIVSGIHPWAATFLAIGTISAIAVFVKFVSFNISGTKLSTIVRSLLFKTMLKQEKGWYDDEDNSTSTLSTLLSVEAGEVQGAVGIRIGSLLEVAISLVLSLCVAFAYSWLTTLVILGFMPIIIIGTVLHLAASTSTVGGSHDALRKSTEFAIESLNNIQTVQAFGLERYYYGIFKKFTIPPYRRALWLSWLFGVTYSFSQAIVFFGYIITFRFGAYQVTQPVDHYTYTTFDNVFRVFAAIVFASIGIGAVGAFVPDANKAKAASIDVFRVIDRLSLIDGTSEDGTKHETCEGVIKFQDVGFYYPTRLDTKILSKFNLNTCKLTVGLVGPSGTGKSTILALVQRIYDTSSGLLTLDGNYIADLNVGWLRSQIGIVSQEPVLFDASIAENIRYGALFKEVSDNEVISAAKAANIHDFIDTLPMGYNTNVGAKGTQLSGGQKQRIAIARALVRDPKILLLDEATSALDTESEKVVQEALDKARKGRTTIIIAHRLSTIHNADIIAVMKGGKVVEVGAPSELLKQEGGIYYKMVYNQNKAWKDDSAMTHLNSPAM